MSEVGSKDYYNYLSRTYGKVADSRVRYTNGINAIISAVLSGKQVKHFLDVGCGDGVRSKYLIELIRPSTATLIDTSDEMVRLARKRVPDAEVVCIDALEWSTSLHFDVITTLWNVIGHFPSKKYTALYFQRVHSLLAEKGLFIFDVNNRYNYKHYGRIAVIKNGIRDLFKVPNRGYFNLLTGEGEFSKVYLHHPDELDVLIIQAGLSIVKKVFVNYQSGAIEHGKCRGQLLYIVTKR